MSEESTALALPSGMNVAAVFSEPKNIDPLIKKIRDEVSQHVPDLTTEKGRKEIASLAYKVSRSKTALDDAGKTLTEDIKKQAAVIDAARKKIRDQLDALRDEVRKPLTDWEAADELRRNRAKGALSQVQGYDLGDEFSSADVMAEAARIKAVEAKPEYAEYLPMIEAARASTLETLRAVFSAAKKREDQEAELAKLRAEAAAREEADRIKAEQESARQAEIDRARREAEEAEARRIADEQRAAQIEAEKAQAARQAAEQEREAAARREADLAREAAEQAERHRLELIAAEEKRLRDLEAAAQAERDRLAAEQRAVDEARLKREADIAHRAKITSDIANALRAMSGAATPELLAEALIEGRIPHVTVNM